MNDPAELETAWLDWVAEKIMLEPPAEVLNPTETIPSPRSVRLRASTDMPDVLPVVLLVAASERVWLVCATVAATLAVMVDPANPKVTLLVLEKTMAVT